MFEEHDRHELAAKAIDRHDRIDWVWRGFRLFLLLAAILAAIFSIAAVRSCEFLEYQRPRGASSNSAIVPTEYRNMTYATLGIYRFSPEGGTCIGYNEPIVPFSLKTARAGAVLGALLGCFAVLLLLVEFLFCRFWCSRTVIVWTYLAAIICQAISFSPFAGRLCHPEKNISAYFCGIDMGAIWSIVAMGLYLLCSIMACLTPHGKPLMRLVREMEKRQVRDPCCCSKSPQYRPRGVDLTLSLTHSFFISLLICSQGSLSGAGSSGE
jgi:hypothetical protein